MEVEPMNRVRALTKEPREFHVPFYPVRGQTEICDPDVGPPARAGR